MASVATNSAPIISHRRILAIAGPIMLANVTVPLIGIVDTGVVGQLGEAAPIGAVGIGSTILTAFLWIFGFLRMGTTGLTAQAIGAGDQGEVATMLLRALLIGAGAGCLVLAVQVPLFWAAFKISPASAEVEELARRYMQIRILSAPAAIGIYALTGWLIAMERTGAVMAIQLFANILNISLDLLFVLELNWGVSGVALATFIAEWGGLLLGLYLCRAAIFDRTAYVRARLFDRAILLRMATVNSDILIRSAALQVVFITFVFYGASFSDGELAANQILVQMVFTISYALDGFALGAETLVGQALGAKSRHALRRASIMTSIWAAGMAIALAVGFAVLGPWIITQMTSAPDVREIAGIFLIYMIIAPIIGWPSWMFDGIFIGATRTADMRNMMLLSLAVYLVSLPLLLPAFGNHGLWAALLINFALRGATLAWRYPLLERSVDG